MIYIVNLRYSKPKNEFNHIRIDRSSALGNPFYMHDESERDAVCDAYENYFMHSEKLQAEAKKLKAVHDRFGDLYLYCWCTPKRCHGETIKRYIESI